MTRYTYLDSPLGKLLLLANNQALSGLYFADTKQAPSIKPDWIEDKKSFTQAINQLQEYFAGQRKSFDLPLERQGTEFQKTVWQQLDTVPYGRTVSYQELAAAIGKPKAVRAVGTALGNNPVCIIGPCHRALATNGSLGGYAGGLENKQYLLQLERPTTGQSDAHQ